VIESRGIASVGAVARAFVSIVVGAIGAVFPAGLAAELFAASLLAPAALSAGELSNASSAASSSGAADASPASGASSIPIAANPAATSPSPASLTANEQLAARGYELLTTKPYLPPDFDQQTFDELWKVWEEPLRSQAEAASPGERRRMAFERYGLTVLPGDESGRPQQYVVDERGQWTMNCLACHQGKVAGRVIPGVANSLFALGTLTDDVRETKLRLEKTPARMEIGGMFMPLGTSIGVTNAVNFGVALMARRDPDLNIRLDVKVPPKMVHHDHDAPAWWQVHRKQRLYIDNFADKGHRALMQFMLVKENGPAQFRGWEEDFKAVEAWIESLRPPKYPFEIDRGLAERGEVAFVRECATCHGEYGPNGHYPEKLTPLDEIGTDSVRLRALTAEHRRRYGASWFNDYRAAAVIAEPDGYLAPPLDGVWATAPYFHNGSVPTLWAVLHPSDRPVVWRRTPDGYDRDRLGLEIETASEIPRSARAMPAERRRYYDTRQFGKSAAGHPFAESLDEEERRAVLEYLKTL